MTFANLDHSLFTFVLTELSAEFGWSDLERGIYIAITFVVAGVLITQIGALADRLGRRAVLLVTALLTPVFVTALAFAPTTVSLLIAHTLGFTTSGVQSPLTGTLVFEESSPRLRGLFTGVLQIGFPLGFFLASLFVFFIYETCGWRYIFLLSLLFLPYAWIIYRYLKDSQAWLDSLRRAWLRSCGVLRRVPDQSPEYHRCLVLARRTGLQRHDLVYAGLVAHLPGPAG